MKKRVKRPTRSNECYNPFKRCANYTEFFSRLRTVLELKRKKKFRVWKLSHVFIDDNRLRFCIRTEYTKRVERNGTTYRDGWTHLAADLNLPIDSSSGSGDGKTYQGFASILLDDVPAIAELHRRCLTRETRRASAPSNDALWRKLNSLADMAQATANEYMRTVLEEFDKNHPETDLWTGRCAT